jgi:DNA-binding HxlR family transcriptional regulator
MSSTSGTGSTSPRSDAPQDQEERSAGPLAWTVTTQEVIGLLGRKWAIPLLRELASGTKRRFQLHHAIKGVTPKILTDTLRFLERDGVIERVLHDDGHGSKSIAYQLTDLGRSLGDPLAALYRWGREHLGDVHQSRAQTDELWTGADDRSGGVAPLDDPESPLK